MSKPFLSDNFVQSQIGSFEPSPRNQWATASKHRNTRNMGTSTVRARNSLKQKINQLVGLCQNQNNGIKSKFKSVIGAERQILDLMKEELEEQENIQVNKYVNSYVEMVPKSQEYLPPGYGPLPGFGTGRNEHGYEHAEPYQQANQRKRSGDSQYHQADLASFRNQQQPGRYNQYQYQPQVQTYQTSPRYGNQVVSPLPISSPKSPYHNISNTYNQNRQSYQNNPYDSQGQSYGPAHAYGQQQSFTQPKYYDGANIIKSKVIEVKDQNRMPGFGYRSEYQSQPQYRHQQQYIQPNQQFIAPANHYDDAEVQQLQQEVGRLKNICRDYENYLSSVKNSGEDAETRALLTRLKDQGEDIRLNTIALLKNTSPPKYQVSSNVYANTYNPAPVSFMPQSPTKEYRPTAASYNDNRYSNPTNNYGRGGQSNIHQELRQQLQSLRNECQQLHFQNDQIKNNKARYLPTY